MPYRLKPPRIGGAAYLRDFIHDIGFERACKIIDVHPSTMRRWLREDPPPPQTALQALYWLTGWGFQDAFSDCHWAHQANTLRVRQLQAQLDATKFTPSTLAAANDEIYNTRPHLVASPETKKPALGGL